MDVRRRTLPVQGTQEEGAGQYTGVGVILAHHQTHSSSQGGCSTGGRGRTKCVPTTTQPQGVCLYHFKNSPIQQHPVNRTQLSSKEVLLRFIHINAHTLTALSDLL